MTIEKLPDRRRRVKRVIVRVEPELDVALKRAAEKDGRTVSGFLRSLAVEHLEQQTVEAA